VLQNTKKDPVRSSPETSYTAQSAAFLGVESREQRVRITVPWRTVCVRRRKCLPEPRSASWPAPRTASWPPGELGATALW